MAVFKPNTPVIQKDPMVKVEVTPQAPLALGLNRFRLTVLDNAGNESEPAFLEVIVKDKEKPTAVLDLLGPNNQPVAPPEVTFGSSFTLSGARSRDVAPGQVVEYRFTLVGPA